MPSSKAQQILILFAAGLMLVGLAFSAGKLRKWVKHQFVVDVQGYVVRLDAAGVVRGPASSVSAGDRLGFAVAADRPTTWQATIVDGHDAVVAELPSVAIGPQKAATTDPWLSSPDYPVATSWTIPAGLASGLYHLRGSPGMFFVLRENLPRTAPLVVLMPTNTVNAYSVTEGRSLYNKPTMVTGVTFLRPQDDSRVAAWLPFLRWIAEQKPFAGPIAYAADHDMDDPALLSAAKVLIVFGHSEYWTRQARLNFDAFVGRGGSAIMAGGDDMWWQTRYSDNGAAMFVYRALARKPVAEGGDPTIDPLLKTMRWDQAQLAYPILPSIGGDFKYGGYGQLGDKNGLYQTEMTVAEPASPMFRGLDFKDCDRFKMPRSTEYDGSPIIGLDAQGRPVADTKAIGAYRYQLLAYEWAKNDAYQLGTMQLLQRTPVSGFVLHMGARECCMTDEFYQDGGNGKKAVQKILSNAVDLFLSHADPFAGAISERVVAFPMTTPWKSGLPPVPPNACAPIIGGDSSNASGLEAE